MRTTTRTILLLALSVLLVQCAAIQPRPTVKQDNVMHINPQKKRPVEPIIIENELHIEAEDNSSPIDYSGHSLTAPVSTAAAISYDFKGLELEHVSHSYYNPFDGDEIHIDLDRLRGSFCYPLNVSRFSSGYGMRGRGFHSGIDLLENANAPIYAAFDGTVRISKPYAGYGNIVVLRHDSGLETVYSHNTTNLVKAGDIVRAGDQIATVGRTGRATANHLHFEIRIQGQTIDPQILVDTDNSTLKSGTLILRKESGKIIATNEEGTNSNYETRPIAPKPIIGAASNTKAATGSSTGAKPKADKSPTTKSKYHTVVKGDTLSSIAQKHGTSITTLCRLNNITQKTILSLGRKILVK